MEVEQLIASITPEAYERLQYAVETGRWPEGTQLTQEQRDYCMQAVMLYQSKHNSNAEHMSVGKGGEIKFKSKAELKRDFSEQEDEIVRTKL
ncbi:YeaC family protein [Vibrio sp. HN007]|uniref:YeaC family protein n=1 Tax=Vibrio iocasae TaxID=3098914 RepID=UPI0035D49F49